MYFLFHLGSSLSLLLLFPECRDYPARSFLDLRADNAPSVYGRALLDPAVETPTELLLCPLGLQADLRCPGSTRSLFSLAKGTFPL
ncbi:unnamed protein product [Gadus morhua 'NCC']